jgi:hypothetical protein
MKFLNLPIFSSISNNSNSKNLTSDLNTLDQLTQLVLSTLIATLITCSSDYLLHIHHQSINLDNQKESTSSDNDSFQSVETSNLAKLSMDILDKLLKTVYDSDETHLKVIHRNLCIKIAYVLTFYLNKLIENEKLIVLTANIHHLPTFLSSNSSNDINKALCLTIFTRKLIELFKLIFISNESEDEETIKNEQDLTFKNIDFSRKYSNIDIFNLFNQTQQSALYHTKSFKIFSLLLNLLKSNFNKANAIYKSLNIQFTRFDEKKDYQVSTENNETTNNEIKNIDDPNSSEEDEDTTATATTATTDPNKTKTSNTNEDADDLVLIGSWFDDQLNTSQSIAENQNPIAPTTSTNNAPSNLNQNTININNKNDFDMMNSSTSTSTNQIIDLIIDLLDLIQGMIAKLSSKTCNFIQVINSENKIKDLCYILSESITTTTKDQPFSIPHKFTSSFLRFIQFLIVKNLLNQNDQNNLLKNLKLDHIIITTSESPEPARFYIDKNYLSIVCQIFIYRLNCNEKTTVDTTQVQIVSLWNNLFKLIESNVINEIEDKDVNDDINLEYVLLLLFLYHNLSSNENRKSIFVNLSNILIKLSNNLPKKNVILIFCRLLVLFEYLIQHYDHPSNLLLELVKCNLLNLNDQKKEESTPFQMVIEDKVENLYLKLSKSEESMDKKMNPYFYRLININDIKPMNKNALEILLNSIDYDKLYSNLANLLDQVSSFNFSNSMLSCQEQQMAYLYGFKIIWSIVDPTNSLVVSKKFLNESLKMLFDEDNLVKFKSNPDSNQSFNTIQFLRVIFSNKNGNDELNKIRNKFFGSDLNTLLDTFNQFWLVRLENGLLLTSEDTLFQSDFLSVDSINSINQNIELLNYYLTLINQRIKSSNSFKINEQILINFVDLVIKLTRLFVYIYKRHGLLDSYSKSNIEIQMLILNSSCLISNNNNTFSQLNSEFNLIDLSDNTFSTPFIIDLKHYINEINSKHSQKMDLIDSSLLLNSDYEENIYLNIAYRLFNLEQFSSMPILLKTLTSVLLKIATNSDTTNEILDQKIEKIFISLNGDLNCFTYLSQNVMSYFQAKSLTANSFKISSFTFETLFKMCTFYHLANQDDTKSFDCECINIHQFFIQLLNYVEKMLDNSYCIEGFFDIFTLNNKLFVPSIRDKVVKNSLEKAFFTQIQKNKEFNLIELFDNNAFFIFLLTSSSTKSDKSYFLQILSIVNKLFKLNYYANQESKKEKINQILSQLNNLADIDPEFLQNWFSKIIIASTSNPTESNKQSSIKLKDLYTLLQLSIYLAQDNNNNNSSHFVNESASLSVLSSLIQLASKLINKSANDSSPECSTISAIDSSNFNDLIILMDILSGAGTGLGHLYLFQACCIWLEYYSNINIEKLSISENTPMFQSACYVLSYVCDILNNLKKSTASNNKPVISNNPLTLFDPTVPDDLNKLYHQKLFIDFYNETNKMLDAISENEKQNNITNITVQATTKSRRRSSNKSVKYLNNTDDDETYEEEVNFFGDDTIEQHDEADYIDANNNNEIYDNDDSHINDDLDEEDPEDFDDDEDENDEDEDDEDDDDDDDENTYHDFDEKSSYASATSTNASTKVQKITSTTGPSASIGGSLSSRQQDYNEYYDQDDEEEDEEEDYEDTNTSATNNNNNNQPAGVSNQSNQLNRIDINQLFDVYGGTEDTYEEISGGTSTANPTTGIVSSTNNNVPSNTADNHDEDEDEDEDDEDEYGDDFNDNFVIDYEHVDHEPNPQQQQPSPVILPPPPPPQSTSNRNAIYQDIISTITAANAAITNHLQQQQQQPTNKSTDNKLSNKSTRIKEIDDNEDINSKLCTFTITKKDFMNQHWYYCHTCSMTERIGMCTICAKVCHKGHDISYAKYGSFFCDCGAKEDGSCLALKKRVNSNNDKPAKTNKKPSQSSIIKNKKSLHQKQYVSSSTAAQKQMIAPTDTTSSSNDNNVNEIIKNVLIPRIKQNKQKQIEKLRNQLLDCIKSKNLLTIMGHLLDFSLIPFAKKIYDNSLVNTNSLNARCKLSNIRNQPIKLPLKSIDNNSQTEKEIIDSDNQSKLIETNLEQQSLFIVTLGSQEGAFENVKMTYASDHGPQIKQLIQSHSLRRTSMCCLSNGARKHLIVTHEKGKSSHFTILQLNALLKQDSNKRNKLTLTKLNTIQVPFTLISVVANQNNEDYIALTGLKDCYIMYLNENGQTKQEILQSTSTNTTSQNNSNTTSQTAGIITAQQPTVQTDQKQKTVINDSAGLIVLHPSLEGSNYIIKSIWLPGSQTELALVTSDFIKIYDLSIDKISPIYYYLLPMGKIKDVTFMYDISSDREQSNKNTDFVDSLKEDILPYRVSKYIIIMSSCGYLYYEEMNEISSAKNGVYYITNTIELEANILNSNNSIATSTAPQAPPPPTSSNNTNSNNQEQNNLFGGGVSVYFSLKLKMLFWSYQQGKTFVGSFQPHSLLFDKISHLTNVKSVNNTPISVSLQQPLCNWSEIPTHPGLVMAMNLLSNNPVVFMFLSDKILVQEIKMTNSQGGPSKVKIQDMVATRHFSSNDDNSDLNNENMAISCDTSSGLPSIRNEKTTMIILCDDGSLKIYVADSDKTEYWLQPHLQPTQPINQLKLPSSSASSLWSSIFLYQLSPISIYNQYQAKKLALLSDKTSSSVNTEPIVSDDDTNKSKTTTTTTLAKTLKRTNAIRSKSKTKENQSATTSTQIFPLDYFEKCTPLNDVEYGGNDLLEIYNQSQLKSRLNQNNASKYVASTRQLGFKLEITNVNDTNRSLLVGCRIMCGTSSLEHSPQYFEVFNRRIQVKPAKSKWIDICLTREEAFIADNKLIITVGPSLDTQRFITKIDACVCYAKTKESLNWSKTEAQNLKNEYTNLNTKPSLNKPSETSKTTSIDKSTTNQTTTTTTTTTTTKQQQNQISYLYDINSFDRLLTQSLDLFESCLILLSSSSNSNLSNNNELFIKESHLISIDLLSLICPPLVIYKAKSLLFNSLSSPITSYQPSIINLYNNYKDDALLTLISTTFRIDLLKSNRLLSQQNFNNYLDDILDYETLQKVILICKSLIQQQRANNMVKFLNEKFNPNSNGQKNFVNTLNSLFWRVVNRSPLANGSLNPIGHPLLQNLTTIVEYLIEIMHSFLLVELTQMTNNTFNSASLNSFSNSSSFNLIFECYIRMLCSDILDINFTTRKCLLQLLKPPKKSSSSSSIAAPIIINNKTSNLSKSKSTAPNPPPAPPSVPNFIESPANRSSIDEVINFSGLNQPNNNVESMELVQDNENLDDNDMDDDAADDNDAVTSAAAAAIAAAIVGNSALAPYVFNEDDEMLQLAMALSLNEPQFQQGQESQQQQQQQQIPPQPLPRASSSSSTDNNQLTRQNSADSSKLSSKTKRKPTSSSNINEENQELCDNVAKFISQATPPYLLNLGIKLYHLRKILLEKFSLLIESRIFEPTVNKYDNLSLSSTSLAYKPSGLKSIAFFQCILNLMADLNPKEESDKKLLDNIIQSFLNLLQPLKTLSTQVSQLDESNYNSFKLSVNNDSISPIYVRTPYNEIQLICLRTISILLSKSKYQRSGDNCNFIIQTLLNHLCQFNMIDVCLNLMKYVYFDHWKKMNGSPSNPIDSIDDNLLLNYNNNKNNKDLMKYSNENKYHDELGPYFVRDPLNKDSFVIPPPVLGYNNSETSSSNNTTSNNNNPQVKLANTTLNLDLFDNYTELLTEILIRLPYQMKKLCLSSSSSSSSSNCNTTTPQANAPLSSSSQSGAGTNPQDSLNLLHQQNLALLTNTFDFSSWTHYLCEYLVLPQCYYLKRLIKKLLQILCGSKDKYRKFKDQHLLTTCIRQIVNICYLLSSPQPTSTLNLGPTISQANQSISTININPSNNLLTINNTNKSSHINNNTTPPKLTYYNLIKLVEHLKTILEVAVSRTNNWQRFCAQNPTCIQYLIDLALLIGVDSNGSGIDSSSLNSAGNVASASTAVIIPNILQLLLCALGGAKSSSSQQNKPITSISTTTSKTSLTSSIIVNDEHLSSLLANSLFKNISRDTLLKFIRTYLLEAAQSNIRWTLHSLLYSLYKNSLLSNQDQLYDLLVQIWPDAIVSYGQKSSQYVDLIGYIILKSSQSSSGTMYENQRVKDFLQKVIDLFQSQNILLFNHPNCMIYNTLSKLVNDFEGFYLESDPCFICNQIETPITNIKLNSIKADSRFTTNQQIFKLVSCHSISKILIKISEIRKAKMVSCINVYYTSKSIQSIVDLKMNTKLWCKAKRVNVDQSQQEVKIEFQLPIIASNLIIEYSDFYDRDAQTNTETTMLQCPRCSAAVPSHPGVCNTCGENVFQCHKCRSINYDERDPFLCNSCGFCKFAKFDFTIVGRPCCAVDTIESEDDRKQTLQNISNLLERADKTYYSLSQNIKPALEALIIKLNEQNVLDKFTSQSLTIQPPPPTATSSGLNSVTAAATAAAAAASIANLNQVDLQQINYSNLLNAAAAQNISTSNSSGVIGIRLTPLTVINNQNQANNNNNTNTNTNPSTSNKQQSAINQINQQQQIGGVSLVVNKTIQSIIQKYTIECKSKFDELAKIVLKLNLCRKELREYDKQFKSYTTINLNNFLTSASYNNNTNVLSSYAPSSQSVSRKTSIMSIENNVLPQLSTSLSKYINRNNCYGCAMASVDACITLFRVLMCANQQQSSSTTTNNIPIALSNQNASLISYVRSELCKQGVLEELINFNLKRANSILTPASSPSPATQNNVPTATNNSNQATTNNSNSTNNTTSANANTANQSSQSQIQQRLYDRDVINLIYLLIRDNPEGSEIFHKLIIDKLENFLGQIESSNQLVSINSSNFPLKHEITLLSSLMTKQEDSCWEMRFRLVIHILLRSLNVTNLSSSNSKKLKKDHLNNPVLIECLTLPCLRILNHIFKTSTNISLITQLAAAQANSFRSNSKPAPPNSTTIISRYNSEPATAAEVITNNNVNMPNINDLDPLEFIQTKWSYYEKWLNINNAKYSNEKFSSKQIEELNKLKVKYFAVWRKYTLKKRAKNQAKNIITSVDVSQTEPTTTKQEIPTPKIVINHQTSVASSTQSTSILTNLFEYDLRAKWLKHCLFCASSRSVRQLTCNILQNLFLFYSNSSSSSSNSSSSLGQSLFPNVTIEFNNTRKFQLAELLCQFLDECSLAGECFGEYFTIFKQIINDKDCKYRLVLRHGVLSKIESLLLKEIRYVSELERLSESSILSDRICFNNNIIGFNYTSSSTTNLTLGYSIKCLTELLSMFLKENNIKNKFKSRLIATVLNSYLSLKKLVFQRTKIVEEAQEKLLNILEQLTNGNEIETRKFMSICIDTVNNFDLDDLVTPVFIFERLCNIIYPEEVVDNKEFLIILEKDPNQEDYLQGRMLGNPYSSNEPGLGPLMRNIKNKICTDCELIALLEDDNGMELLVNNKIISLDLPVRDVYKKVWLNEVYSEHEPMRIVYRMTGLSGDATEDIIDNLDAKGQDSAKNDEEIYRMADELAENGALAVMLERLSSITQQNFTFGKPLLSVILKLLDYALKLSINRTQIIIPEMKAITTMLQTLNMMLKIEQAEPNKIGVNLAEQLLNIMELILSEASKQPSDVYAEFSSLCGDTEQLEFLLNNIKCTFVRSHPNLLQALMKLIPFLSFGDEKKMKSLIAYFSTYISNFDEFDKLNLTNNSNNEDMLHLECFCVIVNGIEIGEMGKKLRDLMRDGGVVDRSIEYLLRNSPKVTTYLNSDYEIWKDFINRNSLPYVLRILTGLCRSNESIQDLIGESCIPILHKLEQFSSGNLVGVLAEDLLVALKQNQSSSSKVAAAIEEVRNQTKLEKKKLAMAMRQKQLTQLGMKTNEKGQLIASDPSSIKTMTEEVEEEKGHICCICREGYKYHPQKVLAIYIFSKKCELDPLYEAKARKTVGYTTVTHFNLVHIDCHTNAIRSARTCRDEWENAALQNANTKCNGILPIWGPDVTETLFSNALARHNNYLLEATAIRDSSYVLSVHDLKLLLLRFAENLSFSEDSGGGGRESNINLIPYMIHAILYSVNTAKYVPREEKNMTNFLEASEKLVSNSFECDNVFYYLAMSLVIMKPSNWISNKLKFLQRILLTVHSRLVNTPALDKQRYDIYCLLILS